MKIRFHEQILRFRLDEAEVAALVIGEVISSKIHIGPAALRFVIEPREEPQSARLDHDQVTVVMPAIWTADWDVNDVVGFQFNAVESNHESLTVIIEKDYPCAHTSEGKAIFGKPVRMDSGSGA